jgi:hypothetical protein
MRKRGKPPQYPIEEEITRLAITNSTPKTKKKGGSIASTNLTSDNENGTPLRSGEISDSEFDDNGYCFTATPLASLRNKGKKLKQAHSVYTFSEWPGQSEGEPVDLPHIWNVISMMYPEDYSKDWIDYMLSAFKVGPTNAFLPEGEEFEETLAKIPPLGSLEATLRVVIRLIALSSFT